MIPTRVSDDPEGMGGNRAFEEDSLNTGRLMKTNQRLHCESLVSIEQCRRIRVSDAAHPLGALGNITYQRLLMPKLLGATFHRFRSDAFRAPRRANSP